MVITVSAPRVWNDANSFAVDGTHFCRVVVVILVSRHRFLVIKRPGPLFGWQLAQHAGHLTNVDGHRSTASAYIVHADISCLLRVCGHLPAAELQRIQLERKLRQAGEIGLIGWSAVRHRLLRPRSSLPSWCSDFRNRS